MRGTPVIASDLGTFDRAFRRVCGAFRVRLKADEAEDLSRTYFKILEAYPLDRVLLVGKAIVSTSRRFPLAADWVAELDATAGTVAPADRRQMTTAEVDEYEAAARAHWEGPECACAACSAAQTTDRPLRYVPTLATFDDDERAYNARRQLVQVVGHWAHGDELRRWYEARSRFYASAPRRFRRALRLVAAGREPGVEG